MKKLFILLLIATPFLSLSAREMSDSLYMVEQVDVTSIKQGLNLRHEPLASTILNERFVEDNQIDAMKSVSGIAPNFYIPDYGSRITSSIYVRGLGARIDQPVVGLNIDNVPYLNKNAFDTDVMDIARMEILRGPQSTLYGRNTMGGVVNIYTISPFDYQGVKIGTEYSSGNTYKLNGSIYKKISERLALSVGGYYNSTDGLFKNEYTGENCDTEQEAGGRLRLQYRASRRTFIDNTFSLSFLDQGGYAYRSLERGDISYNDPCSYDRTMVSNGLSVSHKADKFTLTSVTGYQYLDDSMTLDQDFSPESIFNLTQATLEHSITEDIVIRGVEKEGYNYLFGAFGFYKNQKMGAPVTFKEAGIETLILDNINGNDYYIWDTDSFVLDSDFTNQTFGAALYHESSYKTGGWDLSAAIRFDYEKAKLDYHSFTSTGCKRYNSDDELVWVKPLDIDLKGSPTKDFFEILPRFSATYKIDAVHSVYATISKGYKAGGFNTQMFSDILQQELMAKFGLSALYTAEEIISYKPEYSWNYEVGGHFTNGKRTIMADIALFYIDCRDQQLTVFPEGMVTGRMMTNAGRSRSYGAEFSATSHFGNFRLNASYGYTNAKFIEYDDNEEDYAGNYVPYAPQHTLYGAAIYTISMNRNWLEKIEIEANTNGAGAIYWNESNSIKQPLYALLGAALRFTNDNYSLSLWGRNLTNKAYDTFYFESMGCEFMQQGKPITFGATLNITL
ncbi:MAG: TonB-dependent receptor [Rikenellaceae bacterium]